MTPRSGLYVALAGFVLAALCGALVFLLSGYNPDLGDGLMALYLGFMISLDFGVIFGLIVMAVGLVLAGILALTKQVGNRRKPPFPPTTLGRFGVVTENQHER